jgi:hypothetical protein
MRTYAYFTDARISGTLYRGELWYGTIEKRTLVALTKDRYVTVEDAQAGARRYIRDIGARTTKVA